MIFRQHMYQLRAECQNLWVLCDISYFTRNFYNRYFCITNDTYLNIVFGYFVSVSNGQGKIFSPLGMMEATSRVGSGTSQGKSGSGSTNLASDLPLSQPIFPLSLIFWSILTSGTFLGVLLCDRNFCPHKGYCIPASWLSNGEKIRSKCAFCQGIRIKWL